MSPEEVGITGIGVACALGNSPGAFTRGLQGGVNGIRPVTRFDVSEFYFKRAGEILDLDVPSGNGLDRASVLALYAAGQAVADCGGADRLFHRGGRTAVVLGTTCGGIAAHEAIARAWREASDRDSADADEVPFHRMAWHIADAYGLSGPAITVTIACASGSAAVAHGADLIRSGVADVVLVGGSDTVTGFTFSGFSALRAMTRDEVRPFDRNRTGMALGEGAAVLVLERIAAARRCGRRVYAGVAGYGLCNDAYHSAAPDPEGWGMARSIRRALAMAGRAPAEVQYINAHGTATQANDLMEAHALHKAFGSALQGIPVSATKSMIGHTLGAAGAIEMVACVLALEHGFIPPTINIEEPDPECDLDIVPNEARAQRIERILTCNAGFAGNNCAVVLEAV